MIKLEDLLQLGLFMIFLFAISYPFGIYIFKVAQGEKTILTPIFKFVETAVYYVCKVEEKEEQSWFKYSSNLLLFSMSIFLITFILLYYQSLFPLNPQSYPGLPIDLSFNTAASFLTNTNWQAYSGEATLSYFSQMVALTPMNFLSAAIGISALFAILRGLCHENKDNLGNFWVDLTRVCLYILLPLSFLLALFYISQGVIQNLLPYSIVNTLEGSQQTIAQGPVASQIAIKMLGTNGGGFFATNSAHPFENPTAIVNIIQIFSAIFIPSALVFTFGKMANHMKHAISIWTTMALLCILGVLLISYFETKGNYLFNSRLGLSSIVNLEGKEIRFALFGSSLFTNITTDLSLGATIVAHSSLLPLASLVTLTNMLFNEVIFGGVGSGLYGMILHIIIAVFLAGLMVGRAPEYLGKKIESNEIQLAILPLIGVSASILIMLGIASMSSSAMTSIGNPGPHGFSEMLYAYTSATQNNGSSFSSLNANTPFWNYTTAISMLFGRFLNILSLLALAGFMGKKKIKVQTNNTFPVHGIPFIALLIGVIVILGALVYLPALTLGPILEHLQLISGKLMTMGGL